MAYVYNEQTGEFEDYNILDTEESTRVPRLEAEKLPDPRPKAKEEFIL